MECMCICVCAFMCFQICLPWLFTAKMLTVHIQCLLRVGGSILAGVFLTSFFCFVPESSYSSNASSSSLLVAWYSNCSRGRHLIQGCIHFWYSSSSPSFPLPSCLPSSLSVLLSPSPSHRTHVKSSLPVKQTFSHSTTLLTLSKSPPSP